VAGREGRVFTSWPCPGAATSRTAQGREVEWGRGNRRPFLGPVHTGIKHTATGLWRRWGGCVGSFPPLRSLRDRDQSGSLCRLADSPDCPFSGLPHVARHISAVHPFSPTRILRDHRPDAGGLDPYWCSWSYWC
jgi:hypothetical protein